MKNLFKILCLIAMLCLALPQTSEARTHRNVLLEGFTNAGCSPCAQLYPTWDANVNNKPGFIPIKYHVNWPGTDPMYNMIAAAASSRISYYGITGVPMYVINGDTASAYDTTFSYYDPTTKVYTDTTSPISIAVEQVTTGQNVEAKVTVQSEEALSGKILRIAIVEYQVHYEGTNGETEHLYVVRGMLPNAAGTALTLAPNTPQTVDLTYTAPVAVNVQNVYVVAFVQDDANKEVLQANSNFDTRKAYPVITSTDTKSSPIARSASIVKTFTVTNKGNFAETFNITPSISSYIENPCTVTFDKTAVTLEPNASENVKMTIASGTNPFFGIIGAIATPASTDKIKIKDEVDFDLLTNDAKYGVMVGGSNSATMTYQYMLANGTYKNDVVAVPAYLGFFDEFPPVQYFDLFICAFNANNSSALSSSSFGTKFLTACDNMLNANKKVMINAEWVATEETVLPSVKDFLQKRLNVESASLLQRFTQDLQGNVSLKTFTINGVSSDVIGSSIGSVRFNENTTHYNLINDGLNCEAAGNIVPFCYYDGNEALTAGIRGMYEKGKLAYMSFCFDGINNETVRNTIQDKVIDWLLNSVADIPMLAMDKDYYEFGNVVVGTQQTCEVNITNNGQQDLVLKDISLNGSSDFSFAEKPSTPVTIAYGDTYTMQLIYAPTKTKEVYANIDITSNAPLTPETSFSVSGTGISQNDVPVATLSANSINFDSVEVLKTKDISIKIKNTGKSALTVQGVSFSRNNPAVFEITEGYDTPYTIEGGDEETITVEFQPFAVLDYTGVLDIQTNDPNNSLMQVNLTGVGVQGASVHDVAYSQNKNFEMKVLPNPLVSNGTVQFTVLNNPMNVALSVADMSGRTVETIYSANNVSGTQNIALNLSKYSNGYYNLIANVNGERVVLPIIISK